MTSTPDTRGKTILLGLNYTGKHIYGGTVPAYKIRGEQYTGWKQLTAGGGTGPRTLEEATELVDGYGGLRNAIRSTHPDHGGDPDEFRRVMAAREILEGAGRA